MKKNYTLIAVIITCFIFISSTLTVQAQAYRRGSLMISISEGSTWANYSTNDMSAPKAKPVTKCIYGDRDPIIIEYGVSDRWSVGMSSGTDIFRVNPQDFYGVRTDKTTIKASTSEFTFDGNYHVFVNKRLDLSVFSSIGFFSINVKESSGDVSYIHTSKGNLLRFGTKARYYFWKRLGVFGMISSYVAGASPKDVKGNTFGNNYTTSLNGFAIEAGLCFRILR
jgi:hypothetical protein